MFLRDVYYLSGPNPAAQQQNIFPATGKREVQNSIFYKKILYSVHKMIVCTQHKDRKFQANFNAFCFFREMKIHKIVVLKVDDSRF